MARSRSAATGIAATFLLASSSFAQLPISPTLLSPPVNLKTATFINIEIDGDYAAFVASEAGQSVDLNNDGDAIDGVLFVYRYSTATLINTRTATLGDPSIDSGVIYFQAVEFAQGNTDLNGDGDALDEVLHVFDPAAGTLTNIGVDSTIPRQQGRMAAFSVSESGQGGVDLNGDGDTSDFVLHTYDQSTGTLTNHSIASFLALPHGNFVSFSANEVGEGVDLNGDGDVQDLVMHVVNLSSGVITNFGLHVLTQQINRTNVSFWVFEPSQGGADLNGDGDGVDRVMHVIDLATMTASNTGLAVDIASSLEGTRVYFQVPESDQGATDLNGDGDASDRVLHLYNGATGVTSNLGFAVAAQSASGPRIAFGVVELAQGGTDVNGDGDTSDQVVHLYDDLTGTTQNLGLAHEVIRLEGRTLGIEVFESLQGGTDLNGDGDATDAVLFVHRAGAAAATNVGLALGGSFENSGGTLLFTVSESGQGGVDRNNDGDALDNVLTGYRSSTGQLKNFRRAALFSVLGKNRAISPVPEDAQGMTDLNQDGDATDLIAFILPRVF